MSTGLSFASTLLDQYVCYEKYGGLDYQSGDNPIRNWIRSKLRGVEPDVDNTERAVLAYRELWGVEDWKINDLGGLKVSSDTMCSFWTTYKQALVLKEGEKLKKILGVDEISWNKFGLQSLIKIFINFDEFSLVNENKDFQRFAELTHCLGNMIIVPEGFNGARNRCTRDYWDLSLFKVLNSGAGSLDKYKSDFRKIIEKFEISGLGLDPWFNNPKKSSSHLTELDVKLLEGHTVESVLPGEKSIDLLVKDINCRIQARAKILESKIK